MTKDYVKVIVSGNVIEVYTMEKAPFMGDKSKKDDDFEPITDFSLDPDITKKRNEELKERLKEREKKKEVDRKEERRKQTSRDARNKVRRLTLSNFTNNSKFMTLTFKENITDVQAANKMFKYFMQKKLKPFIDKKTPGFELKYIAVIEFQKRGAVHYHMICNIPYTKHAELLELWKSACGEGSVNIKNIADVDNVGAYIVKYMMKNAEDTRLQGNKMFLTSKGLSKPTEYKGKSAQAIIEVYKLGTQKREVFANSYISEHLGKITYNEYNLIRDKKLTKTNEQSLMENIG